MQKLTNSSLTTYRRCPRQYWYRYELKFGRERTAAPLRIGSAFHLGQELRSVEAACASYDVTPGWADPFDWAVERETVRALLTGYFWRYADETADVVATEGQFEVPLLNPDTDTASRTYSFAGKIDKIIRLPDGRLAVQEYKTTADDISDDSEYWLRLRCDSQISAYVYAARKRGYDVQCVVYDVTRKPGISPKLVPVVDADGFKVVEDANGDRVFLANGKPRQSAGDGMTLKTVRETAKDFGQRLLTDIGERPDFYFARREIARLDDDLAEFEEEIYQQSQQLTQARKSGRWFRNVSTLNCRSCEFSSVCLQNVKVDPSNPPSGFVVLPDSHPELTGDLL